MHPLPFSVNRDDLNPVKYEMNVGLNQQATNKMADGKSSAQAPTHRQNQQTESIISPSPPPHHHRRENIRGKNQPVRCHAVGSWRRGTQMALASATGVACPPLPMIYDGIRTRTIKTFPTTTTKENSNTANRN